MPMNTLTVEEIGILENNQTLLEAVKEEIAVRKEAIEKRIAKISKFYSFLFGKLGDFGTTIARFFLQNKKDSLIQTLQKETMRLECISEKINTYNKATIFFRQQQETTFENAREILQLLCCLMIDHRLPTEISTSLWQIKLNLMERNGIEVSDLDRNFVPKLLSILN